MKKIGTVTVKYSVWTEGDKAHKVTRVFASGLKISESIKAKKSLLSLLTCLGWSVDEELAEGWVVRLSNLSSECMEINLKLEV